MVRLDDNAQLALLFAAALGVRLGWVPTWSRLAFDGHERLYLRAFEGEAVDASSMAWPLLAAIYRALGLLTDDPRALVVFSAVLGSLAVVGVALWTRRRFGSWAGVWAGLLVALLGEHAAWSTSAYNVILPHTLLVWAFVARGRVAALLIALCTAMRPELAVIAVLRGWPALGAVVGVGWTMTVSNVTRPSDPWLALRVNLPMLRFLGPPVLALAVAGVGRRTWGLLAVVALVHLSGAAFDDYGSRHALIGGVLLCVLVGVGAARWGGVVAIVAAIGLSLDTADIARAWYSRVDPAEAALSLPADPGQCVEVTEEPPIAGQPLPSHFLFFDGELDADCVVWGEEFWHRQWSSRGLRDRALRMRTLYEMRPVAVRRELPAPRVYWRLERRSWGRGSR